MDTKASKLVAPASLLVKPNPADPKLTRSVEGVDQAGRPVRTSVPVERPVTLFLNGREIVTVMTIADYPECLAVGYLLNQSMLLADDEITGIDYDDDVQVVVVRTAACEVEPAPGAAAAGRTPAPRSGLRGLPLARQKLHHLPHAAAIIRS